MTEWKIHANCDPEHSDAWEKAGKELGIRLRIGPPDSRGMSFMRGVYTEPLSNERQSLLTNAYWKHKADYENDPFKPDRSRLPLWLRVSWGVCAACWVVWILAVFGR